MKLEVNMVVSNAREAGEYYSCLFNATILSKTNEISEMNEIRMELGNVEIRVLNENKDYGLVAPSENFTSSMWLNLYVDDIETFFNNVVDKGCKVISPINEFPEMHAKNAVIADKFNHVWVINQKYN